MAELNLAVSFGAFEEAARAAAVMEAWPSEYREAFAAEWRALEEAGAQLVEAVADEREMRVEVYLSEAFKRLLGQHGVAL